MDHKPIDPAIILAKADSCFDSGDIAGAMTVLESGYGDAVLNGDKAASLSVGNELLGFYRSFGRVEEAEKLCSELLALLDDMGLSSELSGATTLLNVGTCFKVLGRLGESEKCYDSALRIYQSELQPDDMLIAALHNNRGLLYRDMGEYGKAKDEFLMADRIACARGSGLESATTRVNLASLLSKAGDLEEAEKYVSDAIDFFESPEGKGDYHSLAAYAAKAELAWRKGNAEEAAAGYRFAASLAEKIGAPERDRQAFLRNAEWIENRSR